MTQSAPVTASAGVAKVSLISETASRLDRERDQAESEMPGILARAARRTDAPSKPTPRTAIRLGEGISKVET